MLICFLRHGETLWNREKRIQGTTPHTDLTDFGVRLAEWTRDGLAARGIRFDRAYTSPLRRAAHTAEIILRGQGCPLVADARLREMAFGPYEGTTMGDGRWEDENIRAMFQDPENYRAPDGAETFEVLAVSHGGLMRTLLRILQKTPLTSYWQGRQPNCCAHLVSLEKGVFSLVGQSVVFYDAAQAAQG